MTQFLSSKLKRSVSDDGSDERLTYWCQGCEDIHQVRIKGPDSWGWNGDVERPVFTPSVLTRSGHHAYDTPRETCWCTYRRDNPDKTNAPKCYRCHTFVGCNGAQPGEVIFLGDCTHALAGTVQPLPDLPDYAAKAPA